MLQEYYPGAAQIRRILIVSYHRKFVSDYRNRKNDNDIIMNLLLSKLQMEHIESKFIYTTQPGPLIVNLVNGNSNVDFHWFFEK